MPVDVFAEVPQDELRAAGRRRSFSRGEVVFHEGDPGDSLHRVARGRFAARITTPVGDIATFGVHGPGEVFGLLAVLHPEARRTATVVALEPAETLAMPASAFARIRAAHPEVASAVEQLLVEMLTTSSNRLVEALYTPVHLRVRARLRDLARIYGSGDGQARHDSAQPGGPRGARRHDARDGQPRPAGRAGSRDRHARTPPHHDRAAPAVSRRGGPAQATRLPFLDSSSLRLASATRCCASATRR